MKDIELYAETFEDRRRAETRTCPQCTLAVENPFAERCPRCYAQLPRLNVHCQGCFYQQLCPVNNGELPESHQHHADTAQ